MFCPRCGAESEEGSRYCASCGNELPREAAPTGPDPGKRAGFKVGFERMIGTSRRTRLVTLATAAALLIAVAAFIALDPNSDEASVPQDALTKALDAACVRHKAEIAKAQGQALSEASLGAVSRYADSVVSIAGEWRMEIGKASVPPGRSGLIDALSAALLEVEIEAGTLARTARESNRSEVAAAAARVDAATSHVEEAVHSLELERCGRLEIAQGRLVRQ